MMRRALTLLLLAVALGAPCAEADDAKPARPVKPPPPPPPAPLPVIVHVPADELDVLLKAQGKGVVLTYKEFVALRDAAEARRGGPGGQPPVDGALLSASGTLDLTDAAAARLTLDYAVRGLAPGPRSVAFPSHGIAFEEVAVSGAAGASATGRYEEKDGEGRVYLDGPGSLALQLKASAAPARDGGRRTVDFVLPDAAAFALDVRLPPGVEATLTGEGPPRVARSTPEAPLVVRMRPARGGRVTVTWAESARGTEGPSVIEGEVKTLHTVGDGVVATQALVKVDVLRTPLDRLVLDVPADLAVRGVEGPGVTGTQRSEDRRRLTVTLESPRLGAVEVLVRADRPYVAGPGVDLARISIVGATRQHGEVALRLAPDLNVRQVRVEEGRRVALAGQPADRVGVLRYDLARGTGGVGLDLEPGRLRVDANSTYYLNLAEPGQTLIATVTYRVVEGTVFRLTPRFPAGFDLRTLTLNGAASGFGRDTTGDGTVEITLPQGVGVGGEIQLLATLERAQADWLPEGQAVTVPFPVPSAGVGREEGYVAVGADAGFEVLDQAPKDLLAVGAADLTSRGLSAAGLVYGYRIDGTEPSVQLVAARREPLITADVVTVLHPGPRRLDLAGRAIYRIERAGVRRLPFDVPSWAGDQVDFASAAYRSATRLTGERRPGDVPAGYDRWIVELESRVLGTHVVTALWFLDRDRDDWQVETDRALAARVPANRSERLLVVRRAEGLEVTVPQVASDLRALDLAELPAEAAVDPAQVLDVLRLSGERTGLALGVKKHGGAAVLDAIATMVYLETAVAAEGTLRTRAQVDLFNVDRQFVAARLPDGSRLIGAVVDGQPVKPLVDPRGELLITVPTARARDQRTHVALTYDTPLGRAATGRVRIEQPRFPGLEVLATRHLVAVEDGLEIADVGGDLRSTQGLGTRHRAPWIAMLGRMGGGGSSDVYSVADSAAPTGAVVDEMEVAADRKGYGGLAQEMGAQRNFRRAGGSVSSRLAEPADGPPPPAAPSPAPVAVPEQAPAVPGLSGGPTSAFDAPAADPGFLPPGALPHGVVAGGGAGRPGGGRAGPGEGGEPPPEPGFERKARKGQLSLDVPVTLGPVHVVAERIGGGGAVEVELVSREGRDRTYAALVLLTVALGLFVRGRGWLGGLTTILAGTGVAFAIHLAYGSSGALAMTAVADGTTVLAVLFLLFGIGRVLFGRRAPARSSAAALLLTIGLGAGTGTAWADEAEDAAAQTPSLPPGATVIAPNDPNRGTTLSPDDRVFISLAQWLELQRQAFPDRDPELVTLGQVVALRSAEYRIVVGAKEASGTARLVFAQRGRGLLLVPIAFPGLAITEARLDGAPVRLLLEGATYRLPLEREGEHVLELSVQVPMETGSGGRTFTWGGPSFVGSRLDLEVPGFDGEVFVQGAGRVETTPMANDRPMLTARAFLGRATAARVSLVERTPATLPAQVRTRAESRTVHSLRDGGTESVISIDLHVLQGRAPFVDLELPQGVDVLEAGGESVERWETSAGRLRLVFAPPGVHGRARLAVRTFRVAAEHEREESLPELAVRDTTGESGLVIVNGDPSLRLEAQAGPGLFRTGRPAEPDAAGRDGQGRVLGGWRFAARPAPLNVRSERARPRVEVRTTTRVTFGDDRVRAAILATVQVQRAPLGDLVFRLPGNGEVRSVEAQGLQAWWVDGTGEERRLHVRLGELFEGERVLDVRLERRLGGSRDGLTAPRLELEGAAADRGELVLFALPDVEPAPGALPGLKALPPGRLGGYAPNVEGARATHAWTWEEAVKAGLPVVLRTPEQEIEAVVVTQVAPSDEEQRIEHLVLFDVRRGATDRLQLFVPDGGDGLAENDVVRARDLREVRSERATRTDTDDVEVVGRLYTVRLQSPRSGLIEVTVSQLWPPATPVRVVRPENVKATRWFTLVRSFLDGEVDVTLSAKSKADVATWADLPFLPSGLEEGAVVRTYAARAPFTLGVLAKRHTMKQQADAVVLQALGEVVLGLDGEARVRVTYRIYNRAKQLLRVRLPEGAVLFGAVAAGRPVKPLAGTGGAVLLPVPKVPLGGTGYEVGLTYRARAGQALHDGGAATLLLPTVDGVEVDRTAVAVWVPSGLETRFATNMSAAQERDVYGERAQVAIDEVREVLEVAQTGTLDQRLFACSNGAPLLEEATRQLQSYKALGGKAEVVRNLEHEIAKLKDVERQTIAVCKVDALAAQNQVMLIQGQQAANNDVGRTLVDLDGVANGLEDRNEERVGLAEQSLGATWRFNPTSVPLDKAGKDELVELKKRLQTELERRDAEDRSKQVDVQKETESRAQSKAPMPQKGERLDDATVAYDNNRNNFEVNKVLREVQTRQRQLGADAEGRRNTGVQYEIGPDKVIITEKDADLRARIERQFLFAKPGAACGAAGKACGDFQSQNFGNTREAWIEWNARTGYGSPAGYNTLGGHGTGGGGMHEGTTQWPGNSSGGGGGGHSRAGSAGLEARYEENPFKVAARVGLMGVDVDLPKQGRVFWFTAPKAGGPIGLEASVGGVSNIARAALLGGLLALIVLAGRAVARRRRLRGATA